MIKRISLFAVVLLISVSLVFVGCGQKEKDTAGKDKVIELKVHHHNPPTNELQYCLQSWADEIEKKTNGRVKFTFYPGASLGAAKDAYDMVTTGVCDVAWSFVGLFPGRFPVTEVIELPMLGVQDSVHGSSVIWDLYENTDYLKKEYKDVKVLAIHTGPDAPITTKGKKITKLEDMKGLKIRTPGGPPLEFVKQLGGVPIGMAPTDLYTSLEKSVINGVTINWEGIDSFKLQEVTGEVLDVKAYVDPFWVLMNKDVWDSLPEDVKEVIDQVSGESLSLSIAKEAFNKEKYESKVKNSGVNISTLSPEEYKRFEEKAKNVQEKWIKDMEAKGYPAQDIFNKTLELVKKHKDAK